MGCTTTPKEQPQLLFWRCLHYFLSLLTYYYSRFIHCAISNPTNAQRRPRAKHGTAQPPVSTNPQFPATYTRTKQIRRHAPASAAVWHYQVCFFFTGCTTTPKEQPWLLFWRCLRYFLSLLTYYYSRFIRCMISNPMNTQRRPRAKHGTAQPPVSTDPRFPATYTRTKQIRHHAPASAAVWHY
jgi:hypothetical protein